MSFLIESLFLSDKYQKTKNKRAINKYSLIRQTKKIEKIKYFIRVN